MGSKVVALTKLELIGKGLRGGTDSLTKGLRCSHDGHSLGGREILGADVESRKIVGDIDLGKPADVGVGSSTKSGNGKAKPVLSDILLLIREVTGVRPVVDVVVMLLDDKAKKTVQVDVLLEGGAVVGCSVARARVGTTADSVLIEGDAGSSVLRHGTRSDVEVGGGVERDADLGAMNDILAEDGTVLDPAECRAVVGGTNGPVGGVGGLGREHSSVAEDLERGLKRDTEADVVDRDGRALVSEGQTLAELEVLVTRCKCGAVGGAGGVAPATVVGTATNAPTPRIKTGHGRGKEQG